VNPSHVSFGIGVITLRWMYVLAAATPAEYGDPLLTDETLAPFVPSRIVPGDVVGIGIHTLNALRGYEIGVAAKAAGARVVFGGIHATLYPEESLDLGAADAVVMGDGEAIWPDVLRDCAAGRVLSRYDGGRLDPSRFLPGRWDLLPAGGYMWASVGSLEGDRPQVRPRRYDDTPDSTGFNESGRLRSRKKATAGSRKRSPQWHTGCVARAGSATRRTTSAPPRGLDGGDVDLLHRHHRLEGTLCFTATGRQRLGERARGDLPGEAPAVLAPAALAFRAAIADDRVPVAVRQRQIVFLGVMLVCSLRAIIAMVQTARSGCRPGLQSESDVRRDRFPSRFESGGRRS